MTPEQMAALQAACFPDNPWSVTDIEALLARPNLYCQSDDAHAGFVLVQTVAPEAEILTLAVDPALRRQGKARGLLQGSFSALADRNITSLILEVADDNLAARSLYLSLGFAEIARRKRYYTRANAEAVDALVLKRAIAPSVAAKT